MIYLILAVVCSLSIGMIFKYAGQRQMDRLELLTANYLAALAVAFPLLLWSGRGSEGISWTADLLLLGCFTGALFIAGFFLLSLATDLAGMGLAVGVMRVSVVIPFLASWWIWNEVPSPFQGAGLVLAGVAFFMISRRDNPAARVSPAVPDARPSGGDGKWKTFLVLVLVFLSGGLVDTSLKVFDEVYGGQNSHALFLMMIFGVAFLIGFAVKARQYAAGRYRPSRAVILLGILLGIVNYGSVEFLLGAIRQLSGPFVFPANNISIVIGAAVLGVLVWHEHLSRLNWLGLIAASIALLLLNF